MGQVSNASTIPYGEVGVFETSYKLISSARLCFEPVYVEFKDATVLLPRDRVLIYNFYWFIPRSLGLDVTAKDFIFPLKGAFDKKLNSDILTHIYRYLLKHGVSPSDGKKALWRQINALTVFIRTQLTEYQASINIHDLVLMHESEPLQALWKTDASANTKPLGYLEKYLKSFEVELNSLLATKNAIPHNVLYNVARAKILKTAQVRQLFGPIGMKTDINDKVIMYFINKSLIHGMTSIFDFACDSSSAKKTAFYVNEVIRAAAYLSRRQQLIANTIRKVHKGDCGSRVLLNFEVTAANYKYIEGANVFDGTSFYTANAYNMKEKIGSSILIRSPITCRYTDGICEACMGEMKNYITPELNIGETSASNTFKPVIQSLLSTKHHDGVKSISYQLDPSALAYFDVVNNSLSLADNFWGVADKFVLAIPASDVRSLNDLIHINNSTLMNASKFSSLTYVKFISIANEEDERVVQVKTGNSIPFLSKRMLLYMKSVLPEILSDEEFIYIPLTNIKKKMKFPVIKSDILNDSMVAHVETISEFLTKTITTYTNAEYAVRDFCNLLHSKVGVNILHPQVLLKAYLVTDKKCFDTPIVECIDDVHFEGMQPIIINRTIGNEFGFERIGQFVASPHTYMQSKSASPFDLMLGIK